MQIASRSLPAGWRIGMTRLVDENRSGAANVILSAAKGPSACRAALVSSPQNVIPKRSEGSHTARPAWTLRVRYMPFLIIPWITLLVLSTLLLKKFIFSIPKK